MNEEKKIKEKYFDGSTYLQALNEKKAQEALKILCNIEQYGDENKGPDLISKTDNIIYGIEHFEFDSTRNDKKGSRFKQQIGIIDNKVNNEIKIKDKVHNTSVLELSQDLNNYINNYKKIYSYHYSRIQSYLENLNKDYPDLKKEIWFFIEDVTPFGNHYLDNDCKPLLFHPMLSRELIELFEQSSQLQGIIFATNLFGNEKKLFVYLKSKKEINLLKKECSKESVKSLLVQNPLCSTTLMKIDNLEEVKNNE